MSEKNLINKYEDPAQAEVVKTEFGKLSTRDKVLFGADVVETTIEKAKATGWKKWLLKAAIVVVPLILGAILGYYYPDLQGLLAGLVG